LEMKKFNPVSLPYMGAFVQAVLFGLAGYKYFNLGLWGAAAGLGVGAVVNLSMAVASSRISDIAKGRKALAYLSLIGLYCLSPVIICSSLGWSLANLSWSLAADTSILLTGAIAGRGLISQDAPQSVAVAKKVRKSAKKSEEVQEIPAQSTALVAQSVAPASKYPRECGVNGCTYQIKNAQSVGGHMKAKHPASLGIFEPIAKEQAGRQ
jgi:MFS family permease